MTGTERVLEAMRQRGSTGITTLDFDGPTIDGGAPIRRLAARIEELRKRGHIIDSTQRRHKLAVYVLKNSPASVSTGSVGLGGPSMIADAGPVETPALFDPVVTHRPLSPYDSEAA